MAALLKLAHARCQAGTRYSLGSNSKSRLDQPSELLSGG